MRDGSPFGIAGIWENWKDPAGGARLQLSPCHQTNSSAKFTIACQQFCGLRSMFAGWAPDPRDLLHSYPTELMRMGRSRRASTKNDDPSLLDSIVESCVA
jgi:hypothetical protein